MNLEAIQGLQSPDREQLDPRHRQEGPQLAYRVHTGEIMTADSQKLQVLPKDAEGLATCRDGTDDCYRKVLLLMMNDLGLKV